jgi:hypothetical protein
MALDVLDLMNELKWDKSHLCGVSMGGMIAQVRFFLNFYILNYSSDSKILDFAKKNRNLRILFRNVWLQ